MSGNVGIVIVSHSADVARGTAEMVRQMVGDDVRLAFCGGDPGGGLGTNVESIMSAIDNAWSEKGVAILVDLGGASGPLYGTLFMALGKSLPESPDRAALANALAAAIDAVKARGKSDVGQKTMLDVLIPVQQAVAGDAEISTVARRAHDAAEATIPMKAIRGRASFLGERSIGHMDPGARSSALIIDAAAAALGSQSSGTAP